MVRYVISITLTQLLVSVSQVGAGAWVYLSKYAHTPNQALAACIFANLGVAVSDVVADSLVVEKVRYWMVAARGPHHVFTARFVDCTLQAS